MENKTKSLIILLNKIINFLLSKEKKNLKDYTQEIKFEKNCIKFFRFFSVKTFLNGVI